MSKKEELEFLWRENYVDYLWARSVTANAYFLHSGILLYEDSVLSAYATPQELQAVIRFTEYPVASPRDILSLEKRFRKTNEKIKDISRLFSLKSVEKSSKGKLYELFETLIHIFKDYVDAYRNTEPHFIKRIEKSALDIARSKMSKGEDAEEVLARLLSPDAERFYLKYGFGEAERALFKTLTAIAQMRFKAKRIEAPLAKFSERVLREVARRTNLSVNQVSNLDIQELKGLLTSEDMPNLARVNKRQHGFGLEVRVIGGEAVVHDLSGQKLETLLAYNRNKSGGNTLKGSTGFPGEITGNVRIVPLLSEADEYAEYIKTLKSSDVLVAAMTVPALTAAFAKVAAVVTDEGGLMSHAALVAREKRIPCVIGTKIATRILEEGEKVIVDATNGVVMKTQN